VCHVGMENPIPKFRVQKAAEARVLHPSQAGMSALGPKRQFAALQRYGRYRWNTGRSVDAARTAAPEPFIARFSSRAETPPAPT